MRKLWGLLLLLVPGLAAAASPVPTDLYAEVDHALRPSVVLADPAGYWGRTLLLGGMVMRTVSEANTVTIEVAGYRLNGDDRPELPDLSMGRVLAAGADLDGAGLQPGRLVTLVGQVAGTATNGALVLPRLEIRFIYAWPTAAEEAAASLPGCAPSSCCDPWGYGAWGYPWGCGLRWQFDFGYYRHWH